MSSRHGAAALLLLALPLLTAQCICSTDGVNRGDINVVPLDEEWRMGEQLAQEVAQQVRLLNDPAAQKYVDRLGRELVAQTELADREWHFYVVADSAINAFAIPGGHVYVHTGLIQAARNASELAGVVGHEVAHGVARHGTERMTAVYGINAVARLILGGDVGLIESIVAQIIGSGTVAKFSRDDEREADRLGLTFIHTAGYDPEGMAAMFQTLLRARARRPGYVERFFTSHPLTEERIDAVRAAAQELPEGGGRKRKDPELDALKRRLTASSW